MPRSYSLGLGVVLAFAAGCTGAIDGTKAGGSSNGSNSSSGTGTTSPGGPNGSGGAGTTTGTGGGTAMPLDPGRVTMRRLNQTEYRNTVHDLLGTTTDPSRTFLTDTQASGFDNNGDLLSLSPERLSQYQQAAATLADEALQAPLRAKILTCDPATGDACVTSFVTTLGARAYRRALTPDEIASYVALAATARTAGATPDEVMNTVLQAILVSPHFLFQVELDPNPASAIAHPLGAYELASRLSYMIYASMPDDALFASAQSGQLSDPAELQTQLTRMLQDSKAIFAQNFSEQWLGVRTVDTVQPDATLFPTFNAQLGQSMKREVDLFFNEFVQSNLPVESLLTANFTYVDDRLATHYGLPSVGADMKRVDLTTPQRGGLLSMGALMTATSRGNRTSPVSRGKFTLSELLCQEPPAPPAGVVIPPDNVITATTARAFLASHRTDPTCAACHNLMDPIGLALENYDAIGAWRTMDHGQVIDASGTLPTGEMFNGARELSQVVAKDPRYRPCLSGALLTYALGRAMRPVDAPYLTALSQANAAGSVGLRDILTRIVASDPFRQRRGEAPATATGGN
jgi:hypothetical protein